jgi:fumarate reductase iron-sulfur subunit
MTKTTMAKVTISRFSPKKDGEPHPETYDIPYVEGMSVLNALDYVRDNIDGSLAYYVSCRNGKCLGCALTIDGINQMMCTTPFKPNMTIQPLRSHKIIKDLVTVSAAEASS